MDLKMAEQVTIRRLVVWDGSGEPPLDRGTVCTWHSYAESEGVRALLQYVEDHAVRGESIWKRAIFGSLGSLNLPGDRSGR